MSVVVIEGNPGLSFLQKFIKKVNRIKPKILNTFFTIILILTFSHYVFYQSYNLFKLNATYIKEKPTEGRGFDSSQRLRFLTKPNNLI